jgi:hypothetical protein
VVVIMGEGDQHVKRRLLAYASPSLRTVAHGLSKDHRAEKFYRDARPSTIGGDIGQARRLVTEELTSAKPCSGCFLSAQFTCRARGTSPCIITRADWV